MKRKEHDLVWTPAHLSTHLVLTDFENMQGKSASCRQVGQVALTSVVVFDFFICCRGDENKKKKTEARGKEEIQGGKARENMGGC